MIEFSVLASSSRANCTLIITPDITLLVDCGLSARETAKRLLECGSRPEHIDAILITHEHSDHIRGAVALSKKYSIPLYCNPLTSQFLGGTELISTFTTGETLQFGSDTLVHTASIKHDAVDPLALSVSWKHEKIAILTDTGRPEASCISLLENANALVLESNYDEECLDLCEYPWSVKERIVSDYGHLSNSEAARLLDNVWHPELFYVVLAHISEKSNRTDKIHEALTNHAPRANQVRFLLGSFSESTPRLHIGTSTNQMTAEQENYRANSI